MKILVIPELDWIAALQNRVHKIFNRLAVRHEIHIIYLEHEKRGIKKSFRLKDNTILHKPPSIYVKNMLLFYIINFLPIYTYIKKVVKVFKIDLIVTTNFLFAPLAAWAARKNNIPFIFDLVDFQPFHINYINIFPTFIRKFGGMLLISLLNFDISHADYIITTGLPLSNYVKRLKVENVSIISNGVDTTLFNTSYDRSIIQKRYNITSPIISFIGALEYWVDYLLLFQSLSLLHNQFPSFHCFLTGPSRYYGLKKIKSFAAQNGILDHIIFTGRIPYAQVPLYMCASDVCILPFTNNYLTNCIIPMKLFEYLACERPVLSIQLAGIHSIAKNMIFYASNPVEFAEKLLYILRNPQKIREKINAGSALAQAFNWDNLVNKYDTLLQEVHLKFLSIPKKYRRNF